MMVRRRTKNNAVSIKNLLLINQIKIAENKAGWRNSVGFLSVMHMEKLCDDILRDTDEKRGSKCLLR